MDIDKLYPCIIRPEHPFRNILKAFKEVNGFENIFKLFYKTRINIIVIGAGGTGGYVAAEIMRYIANLPKALQEFIYLTVCDGDTFEAKNLTRQLCTEEDIGLNKAVAICSNYSSMFGNLPDHICAYPNYITKASQLSELANGLNHICTDYKDVDGPWARSIINKVGIRNPDEVYDSIHNKRCVIDKDDYLSFANDGHSIFITGNISTDILSNEDTDADISPTSLGFKERSIPIIIDCVDKTTVRNIIHQCLQMYNIPNTIYEGALSNVYSQLSMYMGRHVHGYVTEEIVNKIIDDFKDIDVSLVAPLNLLFTKNGNKTMFTSAQLGDANYENNFHHTDLAYTAGDGLSVSNTFINNVCNDVSTSAYIISSGNSEYTGQVSVGRYTSLINSTKALSYNDIWGVNDNPKGVVTFKDSDTMESSMLPIGNLSDKDKKEFNYPLKDTISSEKVRKAYTEANARPLKGIKLFSFEDFFRCKVKDHDEKFINRTIAQLLYEEDRFFNEPTHDFGNYLVNFRNKFGGLDLHREGNYKNFSYDEDANDAIEAFNDIQDYSKNVLLNTPIDNQRRYVYASDGISIPFMFKNFQEWLSQFVSIPTPYMVKDGLIDPREDAKEEQMSCAERAEVNIQSINANKTAANLVMNYFTEIMNGILGLKSDGGGLVKLTNYCTSFDTRKNTFVNYPITTDFLKANSTEFNLNSDHVAKYLDDSIKLMEIDTNKKFIETKEVSE